MFFNRIAVKLLDEQEVLTFLRMRISEENTS